MSKKRGHFWWVGFTLFALSVIAFLFACIVGPYFELKDLPPDDHPMNVWSETVFLNMLYFFPCLAIELSCIRSIYRILEYRPRGRIKACCVISAILAFSAVVVQVLIFVGALDFTTDSGSLRLQETVLLLTGWPVFIVTYKLAKIPTQHNNKHND